MADPSKEITAVVLAAGEGKRMKSELPKVLHEAAGRPVLAHVLAALHPLPLRRRIVVTSRRRAEIEAAMAQSGFSEGLTYVVQDPPAGTADAVRVALEAAGNERGVVLVVQGGTPLLETATLERLIEAHVRQSAAATLLTANMTHPSPYGRIVRRDDGGIDRIVEERDATEQERAVNEVNAGVYVFDVARLVSVIGKVDSDNAQREYYLPDVIGLLQSSGDRVIGVVAEKDQILGIKSRADLARAAGVLRKRTAERWMLEGVSIIDPGTTYIDASVSIGRDATILPFTFLEGDTTVGDRAEVGPQARVVNSAIGPGARVSFAVVVGSSVGADASVGPFASPRPGTTLESRARIGTFVETKETTVGEDSKANHLAYLGDAEIGRGVNVGAGSITCNWDGRQKHKTIIEDEAYISSDTMLVAPTHIGKRAATGAGAVVRGDVPDEALAVGVPARVIEGKGNRMSKKPDDISDERAQ